MTERNRQWLLARRPHGAISSDDFRLVETAIPEPKEGEILVCNLYLSVDPAQRSWIAGDTYLPAVQIGEVVRSFAVGRVVKSHNPRFKPGQLVQGLFGFATLPGAGDPRRRFRATELLGYVPRENLP